MANKNPQPVHTEDGRTRAPSLADVMPAGSGYRADRDGVYTGPLKQATDQRRK